MQPKAHPASAPPGSGPLYEGLLTVGYHPALRGTTVGPPLRGYYGSYESVTVFRKRSTKFFNRDEYGDGMTSNR